jgi:hypothetical protein
MGNHDSYSDSIQGKSLQCNPYRNKPVPFRQRLRTTLKICMFVDGYWHGSSSVNSTAVCCDGTKLDYGRPCSRDNTSTAAARF